MADVESGKVPTVPMVREALARHRPASRQRLAAYALVRRDDSVLLTRNSARGPHPGTWSLPGGGVDHGERPAAAVAREVAEESGLTATVGELLGVHDEHFTGTAPHGREEDFHGVHLVFAATVADGEPRGPRPGGHHRRGRLDAGGRHRGRAGAGLRAGHRCAGDGPGR